MDTSFRVAQLQFKRKGQSRVKVMESVFVFSTNMQDETAIQNMSFYACNNLILKIVVV